MSTSPARLVLAAMCGLAMWASSAQAGFIRAHEALAATGDQAVLGLAMPDTSAGAEAGQAMPALPTPAQEDQSGLPIVLAHLHAVPHDPLGMTAPSATSSSTSGGTVSCALLAAVVEPPEPAPAGRLADHPGISFCPPLPWTPLRPPRA